MECVHYELQNKLSLLITTVIYQSVKVYRTGPQEIYFQANMSLLSFFFFWEIGKNVEAATNRVNIEIKASVGMRANKEDFKKGGH